MKGGLVKGVKCGCGSVVDTPRPRGRPPWTQRQTTPLDPEHTPQDPEADTKDPEADTLLDPEADTPFEPRGRHPLDPEADILPPVTE